MGLVFPAGKSSGEWLQVDLLVIFFVLLFIAWLRKAWTG